MEIKTLPKKGKRSRRITTKAFVDGEEVSIEAPSRLVVKAKPEKRKLTPVKTGRTIPCPLCKEHDIEVLIGGPWAVPKINFKCERHGMAILCTSRKSHKWGLGVADFSEEEFGKMADKYSEINKPHDRPRRRGQYTGPKKAEKKKDEEPKVNETPKAEGKKVSRELLESLRRKVDG